MISLSSCIISNIIVTISTVFITRFFMGRMLYRDELTLLPNEKRLKRDLKSTIKYSLKNDLKLSAILFDVDDFKSLNTNLGMNEADKVLKEIADILSIDSRNTDEIYRRNTRGDEFLLLAKSTNSVDAKKAAERKQVLINGLKCYPNNIICISIGITQLNANDNEETLMNRVDEALQNAKNINGKNSIFVI